MASTLLSPPSDNQKQDFSPFSPTIAVIVAVLSTVFSITCLLLLYAKHCRPLPISIPQSPSPILRKNSGIDSTLIEALPIFRFDPIAGRKNVLDCAVCLVRFETADTLHLLPKCKHAFHVDCVDAWLVSHSTCPLCRYRVEFADIVDIGQTDLLHQSDENKIHDREIGDLGPEIRRVSGRHSSAAERESEFLRIVVQRPGDSDSENTVSFRRSVDSAWLRPMCETVVIG